MNRIGYLLLFAVVFLTPSMSSAVTGRILEDNEVPQADEAALKSEAEVFKSIGMGIAVSLARCEAGSACTTDVSKDELAHLLETLDKRINDLVARQERQQGDYAAILTAYVDQRENYLRYQTELEKITGAVAGEEEVAGEDTFGETETTAETAPPETATVETAPAETAEEAGGSETDLDVFSDVDEELE